MKRALWWMQTLLLVAATGLGGVAAMFAFLAAVSREAEESAEVAEVERLIEMSKAMGIDVDRLIHHPKDPRGDDRYESLWSRGLRLPRGEITRDYWSEEFLDAAGTLDAPGDGFVRRSEIDSSRQYNLTESHRKKIDAARRSRDAELKRDILAAGENREQLHDYLSHIHEYEAGQDATDRFRVDQRLAADSAKAHTSRAKAWGEPSALLFACAALTWLVRVSTMPAYRVVLRPALVWAVRQGRSAADAARREASGIDAESRRDAAPPISVGEKCEGMVESIPQASPPSPPRPPDPKP